MSTDEIRNEGKKIYIKMKRKEAGYEGWVIDKESGMTVLRR